MKKYVKVYIEFFNYPTDPSSYIPCEVCRANAVDIHHIEARGMGGSGEKDVIENLMALCRKCHIKYGDKKQFKTFLISIHERFTNDNK